MADPVATVERSSKRYIHSVNVSSALAAVALTGSTQVGECYSTNDGAFHVVTAVSGSGVPTLETLTS